jgi:hypothetical protein
VVKLTLSLLIGAILTTAAICLRLSFPSSGSSAINVRLTGGRWREHFEADLIFFPERAFGGSPGPNPYWPPQFGFEPPKMGLIAFCNRLGALPSRFFSATTISMIWRRRAMSA